MVHTMFSFTEMIISFFFCHAHLTLYHIKWTFYVQDSDCRIGVSVYGAIVRGNCPRVFYGRDTGVKSSRIHDSIIQSLFSPHPLLQSLRSSFDGMVDSVASWLRQFYLARLAAYTAEYAARIQGTHRTALCNDATALSCLAIFTQCAPQTAELASDWATDQFQTGCTNYRAVNALYWLPIIRPIYRACLLQHDNPANSYALVHHRYIIIISIRTKSTNTEKQITQRYRL